MDRGRRYSYYRLMHLNRLPSNLTLHWRKLEHNYSSSWSIRIEINLHGQLNRRLGGWRTGRNLYDSDRMRAFAVWDYLTLYGFRRRGNVGSLSFSFKPDTDSATQFRLHAFRGQWVGCWR